MKKWWAVASEWPWWAWVSVGLVFGIGVAVLLLERTRIDHATIWGAETAMQGWVGAVMGSAAAVAVAMYVLRVTIRDERRRAGEQAEQERDRFLKQVAADRRVATEQRLNSAWAEVAVAATQMTREHTWKVEVVRQIWDAFEVWRLNLASEHDQLATDIETMLLGVIVTMRPENLDQDWSKKCARDMKDWAAWWHRDDGRRAEASHLISQRAEQIKREGRVAG